MADESVDVGSSGDVGFFDDPWSYISSLFSGSQSYSDPNSYSSNSYNSYSIPDYNVVPQGYTGLDPLLSNLQSNYGGDNWQFTMGEPSTSRLSLGVNTDLTQPAPKADDPKSFLDYLTNPTVLAGLVAAGASLGGNLMQQESVKGNQKFTSEEAEKARQEQYGENEKSRQFQAAENEKSRAASAANAAAARGAEMAIARRNAILQAYLRAGDHISSALAQKTGNQSNAQNAFDRIVAAIR